MINFYSFFDESFNNDNGNDLFGLVDEDRYEVGLTHNNNESIDEFEVADESCPRGTSSCTFVTSSRYHFDNFYLLLRSQGYNIMRSSETFPFELYVFQLTKEEADRLTQVFYANRRLVPKKSLGCVA